MNEAVPYYRQILQQRLADRASRNPRYSLRAFAKSLGVEAGAFSQILSGKRQPSQKIARRFFAVLDLSPEEQIQFLRSIATTKESMGLKRISPELKHLLRNPPIEVSRELSGDVFRVVSDWYHYAILELTHLPDFDPNPRWIASTLGISVIEAKLAIDRLLQLELLEDTGKSIKKSERWIDTLDKSKTSSAHRLRQKQILEKSLHSLENDPIAERNHSAITMPIDPAKIPEAKERIQKFMWELTEFLGGDEKKAVYELTVNLFPLQMKRTVTKPKPQEKP